VLSGPEKGNQLASLNWSSGFRTYSTCGQILPLQSNVSMYFISSAFNSKSKMLRFCNSLSLFEDLGMTLFPSCTLYRSKICAGDFPYLFPICLILGSLMTSGSPGFCHGLDGDPKGLYEVTVIPLSEQNLRNFAWFK
jgi:hypothetical protein